MESQQAMVFLETWGSTSYEPTRWETKDDDGNEIDYAWSEDDYFPEWLESELGHDANGFVSVLSCCVGAERVPAGYRIAYSYQCGEKECPECETKGVLGDHDDIPEDLRGAKCNLCAGEGHIYWGEEWHVLVLAPRYSYGSGMTGCLYDNGPHAATSKQEAIDALIETFDGYFETLAENETGEENDTYSAEREENQMREALERDGIFYFTWPSLAGTQYCEIKDGRKDQ